MKKGQRLIHTATGIFFLLSSLVFAGIEGWMLFSGDWNLFENDGLALVQTVAKLLLAWYGFFIGLNALRKKKPPFFLGGIPLLAISLAAAPLISNHLGWLFVPFTALFALSEKQGQHSDKQQTEEW